MTRAGDTLLTETPTGDTGPLDLPGAPILRVIERDKPSRDFRLERGELVLGRGGDVHITLDDKSVSRRHLVLRVEHDMIIARDLGSSRGTFLNGVRITAPTPICPGDVLFLGNQRVELWGTKADDTIVTRAPSGVYARLSPALPDDPDALPPPPRRALRGSGPMITRIVGPGRLRAAVPPQVASQPANPASTEDRDIAARAALLAELSPTDRDALLASATTFEVASEQTLCVQGEQLSHLYIVVSGQLHLVRDDAECDMAGPGASIEALAVLRNEPAIATARARGPVRVVQIAATLLRDVGVRDPRMARVLANVVQCSTIARFSQLLRDQNLERTDAIDLVAAMTIRAVRTGTRIASEAEDCTALRIVHAGTISASKNLDGVAALVSQLGEGTRLGGPELVTMQPHRLTYEALTDVVLVELPRDLLLELLPRSPQLATVLERTETPPSVPAPAPAPVVPADAPDEDDPDAPALETFHVQDGIPPLRRPRRRFVRQHDEMDCGAACLAMISKAYGRNISLSTYRARVHVTREGASMWSLVRAAREAGFEGVGVQCRLRAVQDLQLPAIALTKYHFVVVYEVTKTTVVIGDPAVGLRRLSADEFKAEFSEMLLLLRPTERFFAQPESRPGWRKYLALAPGHVRPALEIMIASLLIFAFGLVSPLLSQAALDRVLVQGNRDQLTTLAIALVAVATFSIVLGTARGSLIGFIANRFDTVFSALVYRHVMQLPLNFFMVRRVGDILTRFREILNIRRFVTGDALTALIEVTSISLYIVALFVYSTQLGYLALILTPLVAATSIACSRRLRRLMEVEFPAKAKAQGLLVEQLRALETVKSLGAEVAGRWRWEEAQRDAHHTTLRVEKLAVLVGSLSAGVEQLALTAMLYAAARMTVAGDLTIGKVVAIGMFSSSILGAVRRLATQWTELQSVGVSFGRVDDVLTSSPEPSQQPSQTSEARLSGDIEMRDVWFQYGSDLSPWVLKGVTLTIKRGETVAFVGRSGSGKTTLVQLVNLLYRPTRGSILIDGQDITAAPLAQVRGTVGMVMQDSHLFAGTVFDNIAFGQEDANLDLVMAAARAANAHDFISTLKDGYFTRLKEGGAGLSGGQRQRICLARALYRRPTILVLDEATSALDSESERAVVDAIKVYCRGRTSIVIAHRLSTILHADRIVLLDNGRVVETGTHTELIARGGAYAQLFGAQLAS